MSWLAASEGQSDGHHEPTHLAHLASHIPSPLHHTAGGPGHAFREQLAHTLTSGDVTAVHAVIAQGEAHHVAPQHSGTILDILWEPEPDSHEARLKLVDAINHAFTVAKAYNETLSIVTEAAKSVKEDGRASFREQIMQLAEPLFQVFEDIPPGPRRAKVDALGAMLRNAIYMTPAQGLESPQAGDAKFAASAAMHDAHPPEHGPFHDLRRHLSDAAAHGDLQRIRALIADAERQHLLPPHVGLFLELRWTPEPDTHERHAELAHTINHAMVLAKDYSGLKKMFAEMDRAVPEGAVRAPLRAALAEALAPVADEFGRAPPGAAQDQVQRLLRELLEMI